MSVYNSVVDITFMMISKTVKAKIFINPTRHHPFLLYVIKYSFILPCQMVETVLYAKNVMENSVVGLSRSKRSPSPASFVLEFRFMSKGVAPNPAATNPASNIGLENNNVDISGTVLTFSISLSLLLILDQAQLRSASGTAGLDESYANSRVRSR